MAGRELSAQENSPHRLRPVQTNKQRAIGPPAATTSGVQPVNETGAPSLMPMTAQEIAGQLAGVKDNRLLVEDKIIGGPLKIAADAQTVQSNVEFRNCEFTDDVSIRNASFERNLVLQNVKFDRGLSLQGIHVKGDFQLVNVQIADGAGTLKLNQLQIDGDLRIRNPIVNGLQIEGLTAGNVIIWLGKTHISILDLISLTSGRLSIAANKDAPEIGDLRLDNASLSDKLVLQNVTVQRMTAVNLSVAKRTQFLPTTYIKKRLDLTSANLGDFEWRFPPAASLQLPEVLAVNGAAFGNLDIVPVSYGIDFLQRAPYLEAAYLGYEASLRAKGQFDAADRVYFAMRDHRRFAEWHDASFVWGKVNAGFNYLVGFGHKWLFGYGRSWTYPLAWCVLFVITGVFIFRAEERMEKVNEQAPYPFSAAWYSIDTFVPFLSLGVANGWRPKPECRFLLFYSKFLSLTGLVFLSAMAGALTGSLK